MARDIIPETNQGAMADKQIERARLEVRILDRQIVRLDGLGVLNASYGFKKDQPNNPMYCYVRQADGSRKYVHVGVCKDKQRDVIKRIKRFRQQRELVKKKVKIESRITDILQQQSVTLELCQLMLAHFE